ncbi:hypothetical protein PIB30_002719 [Stylosanthes scabra]|uniref:Uncharacterized protein n=1 Tax=Stylosanthes scabra TaxID=79078 RepID=A0ABU6R3Q7_9FABA|nr:hypothetical protein [Stylosanthes scabra]
MKRTMSWSDDDDDSSGDESPSSHSDPENNDETSGKISKGEPSVLRVPPPKEGDTKQDWSWSTGKDKREDKETEESYEQRQKTREATSTGEQMAAIQTQNYKKNLSFSQKEKRKRELGQASRGKRYVEEEKRLMRESGIYSGFDA